MIKNALAHLIALFFLFQCIEVKANTIFWSCQGGGYQNTISLWTEFVKNDVALNIVENKLVKQGDAYALYDIQIYLHDFLLMLNRCQDKKALQQLVSVIEPVFNQLESVGLYEDEKWICKNCVDKRLIGKEVELYSKQYIAFLTDVVFVISKIDPKKNSHLDRFARKATQVIMSHLYRWSSDKDMLAHVKNRMRLLAKDADGSPKYFFTDKDLWMLFALSNMAQIANDVPEWMPKAFFKDKKFPVHITQFAQLDFELLKKRLFIEQYYNDATQESVVVADLDKGYWRLYRDYQYAGYTSEDKPLDCLTNQKKPATFSKNDLGWDLSHIRRIVRFLEVMDRSRSSVEHFYQMDTKMLPDKNLRRAFINQLVHKIWNGSEAYPLFANYWDGTNGWYRVGYNDGSGRCREGIPPHGLSEAFATGGFATWGQFDLKVKKIALQLFKLSISTNDEDLAFMKSYYPNLLPTKKPLKKQYYLLMFYSSLIDS